MSNIDQIKNLMKEIIKTKDPELIAMATELLQAEGGNNGQDPPKKAQVVAQENVSNRLKRDFPEFVMNQETTNSRSGQPLEVKERPNKFSDDGGEHKDKNNTTPTIELTERRRPKFQKIEQTCTRCNKTVAVHPQHAREFYVCDRCLRR